MPRLKIDHLWLSLPVVLVLWRGLLQPARLLDFWWHLKEGEVILTTGSIPRENLFSYTAAGAASVPHCWLAQTLYAVGFRAGGLPLLIVMNTLLLVVALVPVYHLCRESSGSLRLAVLSASLAAFALALFSGMRPHSFSFAFLAWFYWVLVRYCRRRKDALWVLPPLIALWVNFHGAFVIGLGLIVLFLVCETVRHLFRGPDAETLCLRELAKLAVILVLAVLASLLNPETYRAYAFVASFGGDKYSFVAEWDVPHINRLEGILIFHAPFFLTLLALIFAKDRPNLTELALFLCFAAFGLTAYRNGVWFSLVAAPIVARCLPGIHLADIGAALRRYPRVDAFARRLSSLNKSVGDSPRFGLNAIIALLMLAITIIVSPWVYPRLGLDTQRVGLLEPETPVRAMDFVAQHDVDGNIFHPQVYGDYLIWRLWPRHRSFFDSQVHLFNESLFQDYALVFLDPHWQERLARYDIAFLLLRKNADDNQRMIADARDSPNWQLLYEDDLSVLFQRTPQTRE